MAINAGYINVGKDRLSSGLSATFNLCYKINSSADKEVEMLERLLEEKERTIQILMKR